MNKNGLCTLAPGPAAAASALALPRTGSSVLPKEVVVSFNPNAHGHPGCR